MIEEELPMTGTSTAVELARLSGRIQQVISDHERRLTVLETRQSGAGVKAAAIAGPVLASLALVATIASQLSWN